MKSSTVTVENVERKYQAQISHFESQIKELRIQMESQSTSYKSWMAQIEKSYKLQLEESHSKGSDEIKVYQIEMKKLQSKLTEVYELHKSEQSSLFKRKQYLEKQRGIFNVEIKKLFEINADLEKQVANLKLEL